MSAQCGLPGPGVGIKAARAAEPGLGAAATVNRTRRSHARNAGSTRICTSTGPGESRITTAACWTLLQAAGSSARGLVQVNYNAYCHRSRAFGGKPAALAGGQADYHGIASIFRHA